MIVTCGCAGLMINKVKIVIAPITPEKFKFFLIGSGSRLSLKRAAVHRKPRVQTLCINRNDPSSIIDKEPGIFGCQPVERFNIRNSSSIVRSIPRSGVPKYKNPGITRTSPAKDANSCSGSFSLPIAQVRKTVIEKSAAAARIMSKPAIRLKMHEHPPHIVTITRIARLVG